MAIWLGRSFHCGLGGVSHKSGMDLKFKRKLDHIMLCNGRVSEFLKSLWAEKFPELR